MDNEPLTGGPVPATISINAAARRLGISDRHVRRACALYHARLQDDAADPAPLPGELACWWYTRGGGVGYLVLEAALEGYRAGLNVGDTGRRGRRAGVTMPRKRSD